MLNSAQHRLDREAEVLAEWVQTRREIARLEARASSLLADRLELLDAAVSESPMHRNAIERSMVAEFTAAGRMAKGSVEHAFADARALRVSFPGVRDAFEAGSITPAHVRQILEAASPVQEAIGTGQIEPHLLGLYEAAALEFAETEAPARARAHARELAAALAPRTVTERHQDALSEQYVKIRPVTDELSLLQALLPTHRAEAIMDRLTTMARHQKQHGEDRHPTLPVDEDFLAEADRSVQIITADGDVFTVDPFTEPVADDQPDPAETPQALDAWDDLVARALEAGPEIIQIPDDARGTDQIRAELLTDLLLSTDPSEVFGDGLDHVAAHVNVTIDATTLAGMNDRPAQLDGEGIVHPDTARAFAGTATIWNRLWMDPDGFVTRTDTYRPTTAMTRFLQARDQHCRFPGCRMPVHRTQIDHTHDWAKGGTTSLGNLAHLCLTHHALKHPDIPDQYRWKARQNPD
ncbi:HNH endonuclease signature motif containing protein, partial [Microbacterium sp.]|uniref:HNH endonuclease signature motif containing protein n=1 Tax=Microbacterium sp. TaxID=51671 RepID=UPI003C76CD13